MYNYDLGESNDTKNPAAAITFREPDVDPRGETIGNHTVPGGSGGDDRTRADARGIRCRRLACHGCGGSSQGGFPFRAALPGALPRRQMGGRFWADEPPGRQVSYRV